MVQDPEFRTPAVTGGMHFAVTLVPALAAERDTVGVGGKGTRFFYLLKGGCRAVTTVAGCGFRFFFGSGAAVVIPKSHPSNGDVIP